MITRCRTTKCLVSKMKKVEFGESFQGKAKVREIKQKGNQEYVEHLKKDKERKRSKRGWKKAQVCCLYQYLTTPQRRHFLDL